MTRLTASTHVTSFSYSPFNPLQSPRSLSLAAQEAPLLQDEGHIRKIKEAEGSLRLSASRPSRVRVRTMRGIKWTTLSAEIAFAIFRRLLPFGRHLHELEFFFSWAEVARGTKKRQKSRFTAPTTTTTTTTTTLSMGRLLSGRSLQFS